MIGNTFLSVCERMPLEAKTEEEKKTKELVQANVLKILKDAYGVEEEDFLSAEIEIVPAGPAMLNH